MFEDLSRLIDHQIYLATRTCIRSLQGKRSTSHASSESAATAATSATTEGRRAVSSTSLTSVANGDNTTASRPLGPIAQNHEFQTQRCDEDRQKVQLARREPGTRVVPLDSLPPSLSRIVDRQGGSLAEGFEKRRVGSSYDAAAKEETTRRSSLRVEEQEANKTGRGVELVAIPHDPKTTPAGAASSARRSRTMKTPTKDRWLTPLKPLPQPSRARSYAADAHLEVSPRSPRVVHISRPSPRRVDGAPPLAHRPAGAGASRGNPTVFNKASNNSSSSNVVSNTDGDKGAQLPHTSSQPRSSTTNTSTTTTSVPRVAPREQYAQPAAQQGQQSRRGVEEEEDPDSSQLSNITNITLLVQDVSQLRHFYERVFAVTPLHEDDVSVTFPFNKGRLGVTLMEYPHESRPGGGALLSQHRRDASALDAHNSPCSSDYSDGGCREYDGCCGQQQQQLAPLGRHRDVGMSVTVEHIELVWNSLRILREGKGKGREGDGNDDGLRFGGLAATGFQEPQEEEEGGGGGKPSRILFSDPAGYFWEVTEEPS